jgi:hypothetical protein
MSKNPMTHLAQLSGQVMPKLTLLIVSLGVESGREAFCSGQRWSILTGRQGSHRARPWPA